MDRRRFLTLTGLAAGFGAAGRAPGFPLENEPNGNPLKEARARAKTNGKPILVAWVPMDPTSAHQNGSFWTYFFRRGTERQVALLALCEVVFIQSTGKGGEHINDGLASLVDGRSSTQVGPSQTSETHRDRVKQLSNFCTELEGVLVPDKETVSTLAKRAYLAQPEAVFEISGLESAIRPRVSTVDQAAAKAWQLALQSPEEAARWLPLLAHAALARLYEVDPPGARWRIRQEDPCPPCGMAVIPAHARHFLELYTR